MQFGSLRGVIAIMAIATGLASCGDDPELSAEEQARADAKSVAEILAANTPPPDRPDLQLIAFDDVRRNDLFGPNCSFFERDVETPVAIAGDEIGALKLEGNVVRFAPDAGSAEGPKGTRRKYDGREVSFELAINRDESVSLNKDAVEAPASLLVRDGYDRVVYRQQGSAICVDELGDVPG